MHNDHNIKILIIAPPWVGDMVMVQALLRLLKQRNPESTIDIFAIPTLHALLKRMPEVDNIIASPFKRGDLKLFARFKVGRYLRTQGYTHAYLIPNSFKSALVPFFAKIPMRIGWRGEGRYFLLNDMRVLCTKKIPLMVERFVALGYPKHDPILRPILLPQLKASSETLGSFLQRLHLELPKKPLLIIAPGPEHIVAKRWPATYFADVALAKKRDDWDVWILGGPAEQGLARIIQERSGNACLDLTGKTDLGEVVDVLSLATVVVANDSGLMHVAAAVNRKIIAIYGPNPPEVAPPLTSDKCKMVSLNLPCSPCFKKVCPLGHNRCMKDLQPELVLGAIAELGL